MKRKLSMLLILILVFTSILTGCSGKKGSSDTDTAINNWGTEDTSNTSQTKSTYEYETADTTTTDTTAADTTTTDTTAANGTDTIDIAEGDMAKAYTDEADMTTASTSEVGTAMDNMATDDMTADGMAAEEKTTYSLKDSSENSVEDLYRYGCFIIPDDPNTEEYSEIDEAGFKNTNYNPLSTFSIDVDTASYANLRKNLNYGIIPETDAVRIEEMLNYFDFDYKEPTGNVPFSINTEIGKCPWKEENYLLTVGLQGRNVDKEALPKSNLVFLIDVSGSMDEPDKLPLLKNAFSKLVDVLGEDDKVSIVVYAGDTGVVLDSVRGNEKDILLDAIESLSPGGSTGGAAGIDLAYHLAEENFIKKGNNRIILATDGDFNVGASSVEELEDIIEKKRESGIYLSVMGFGSGNLKDNRMETLADKGNGNYSYIDSTREGKKVLVDEMAGTLLTIAKDVKIQIEFNPYCVEGYRLIGYENRALADKDFTDDTVDAGELGAGHRVTAVYEIIPRGGSSSGIDLKYQLEEKDTNSEYKNEICEIKLRYKEPDGKESKEIKQVVSFQNTPIDGKHLSEDFYFAAAVAEFGMLLRNSEYMGSTTIDSILDLAEKGLGEDENGYRLEFMTLVDRYEELLGYGW